MPPPWSLLVEVSTTPVFVPPALDVLLLRASSVVQRGHPCLYEARG